MQFGVFLLRARACVRHAAAAARACGRVGTHFDIYHTYLIPDRVAWSVAFVGTYRYTYSGMVSLQTSSRVCVRELCQWLSDAPTKRSKAQRVPTAFQSTKRLCGSTGLGLQVPLYYVNECQSDTHHYSTTLQDHRHDPVRIDKRPGLPYQSGQQPRVSCPFL